jgi:hypothetical protein
MDLIDMPETYSLPVKGLYGLRHSTILPVDAEEEFEGMHSVACANPLNLTHTFGGFCALFVSKDAEFPFPSSYRLVLCADSIFRVEEENLESCIRVPVLYPSCHKKYVEAGETGPQLIPMCLWANAGVFIIKTNDGSLPQDVHLVLDGTSIPLWPSPQASSVFLLDPTTGQEMFDALVVHRNIVCFGCYSLDHCFLSLVLDRTGTGVEKKMPTAIDVFVAESNVFTCHGGRTGLLFAR